MKEKWTVQMKKADFRRISEEFGIDPVVARVIRNRGIIGDDAIREYLYGGREKIRDPFLLRDMDRAVEILKKKIGSGKRIRIIGDYDIDGVMSSYILKTGIHSLGGTADVRIPDRMKDGYGLNSGLIRAAAADGVDTILTCDNGIAAAGPVELAKENGMTVVITDHHDVASLPPADAVVDPQREDDVSGSENLCGAAVAWKLIRALGGDPEMKMLQYVGFATVGDVMELTGENRILVREGLRQLRETENPGLRALADVCGISLETVTARQIGFVLGPCINACGRLDSADRAGALLEAKDEESARKIAEELRDLNTNRKAMTENGTHDAVRMIEERGMQKDRVLVLFLPGVHESVAGIIAGRIREKYNRPAFVLTRGGESVKGSGRSIPEYQMFTELQKAQDLLIRFGGHPMAAGLTLREENIAELRRRLNENCALTEEMLIPKIRIDVPMPISYVTGKLISELDLLEPFGRGNEKPVFAEKNVRFDHPHLFGANRNYLKARIREVKDSGDRNPEKNGLPAETPGPSFDAVAFRNAEELYGRILENPVLSIVYEPEINEYMGVRRIQFVITHFQ